MSTQETTILISHGFLSEKPIVDIPRFEKVCRLARELPELIEAGSDTLREELDALPFIDVTNVTDEREARALMRDYHFLQSAYVLAEPQVKRVPFSIAVPSHQLAKRLGQKPMLSYASVILDNWQLARSTEFSVKGMRPIRTFTRTSDEVGFLMPHALIEGAAGLVLSGLLFLSAEVHQGGQLQVLRRLLQIEKGLAGMRQYFRLITSLCEPKVYFNQIRPWLSGFKDVIFEGVSEHKRPQSFIGASGAQSAVLPAIDAALGIRHDHYFSAYVEKLRAYMPPRHVACIEELESGPPLRDFVIANVQYAELPKVYNKCAEHVRAFRQAHGSFARRYISEHDAKALGTGESVFEKLFTQYVKDTEAVFV